LTVPCALEENRYLMAFTKEVSICPDHKNVTLYIAYHWHCIHAVTRK